MQNSLPQNAQKYIKKYLHEKRWKQVVTVLACIVVFCTTYALILPALTMTGDTFCGKEAHQHSDECYEKVLICGQEESDAAGTAPAHTHTAACYEMQPVLVCGQEESDSHLHTEACYQTESVLICGQEESASTAGHVHTDSCYEKTLICQQEEHEHTLSCFSDPDADVESESVWARSTSGAHRTGVWADDVAAVAQTQLGYAESTENYIVTDDGEMKGITRFGQWYGDPYGDWDAMFVSFCLNYAGIPQAAVPYGGDCAEWTAALSYSGLYRSGNTYSLEKGDIVFFDYDGDGAADHAGLVVKVSEDTSSFSSIEGDADNRVQQIAHSAGETAIVGFATLPENPDSVPADSNDPVKEQPADNDAPADEEQTDDSSDALQPAEQNADSDSIGLGETKTIAVGAGETVKLQFIPDYSHEYVFYSSTSGDTYGHLYDANGKQLSYNDDGAGSSNFKITYTLNAGETYYWGTRWYSSSKSGDITVHLELGTNHVYVKNEQGNLVCSCGAAAPESGKCGNDLYWSFDKETGTLSITGTGAMTNYSSSSKAPWAPISNLIKQVTIEEGATSIGNYAFYQCSSLETVSFPSTLTSIGSYAFNYCTSLETVSIPNALTSIGSYAFSYCASLETVSFPSSLRSIGQYAFDTCRTLKEIDLSMTAITSLDHTFPNCEALEKVSLPNTLNSIGVHALSYTALTEIVIPESVSSIGNYAFYSCTALKTAVLPSALTRIGDWAFAACALTGITLPDSVSSIGESAFSSCDFTEVVIPKSVSSIGRDVFSYCNSLTEIRLEAANVTISQIQTAIKNGIHVTVAETAEQLSANSFKGLVAMGCTAISFEAPNYLTAGGWHADFLPEQLNGLPQSEYFVDEQGVFYRIDSETNTASVFYCPPGIGTYTVPKELPAVDGKETPVPVTGVDSYAFSDASDLTALTFESPDAITTLADLAFYRAVNLASINGQSDSAAVLGTFTSDELKTGTMLFWQTKITHGGEQPSGDAFVIEKQNLKLTVSTEKGKSLDPGQAEDGTYLYYTGEAAKTTVTVSNPDGSAADDGTVVRVYFRFDEKNGKLNYTPGTYTVVSTEGNQCTMRVVQTDKAGCYYVELERPAQGDTISIILESSYLSPSSGGGNVTLWCDILTKEEKAAVGNGLVPVDTHQSMNWTTVADNFPITKREITTGASKLVGDGKGGAYIHGLNFRIDMSRAGATLEGMGKDYMRSVDFEDVLTLPEGVTLADDVRKSIQDGTVKFENTRSDGLKFKTAEGREFLSIAPSNTKSNYLYLQNGAVSLDEGDNLVVCWNFRNANLNTEISDMYFTYMISDSTLIVADPRADVSYVADNKVKAIQHFTHSADQTQQAECSATVKEASGELLVDKKRGSITGNRYGDPESYIVSAENHGALPYERLAFLTDILPSSLYMRPADIASVFSEDTEHQLTLTITNATLCGSNSSKTVLGIDGAGAITNTQNTGGNTEYNGMSGTDPDTAGYEASTITIAWGTDDQLQISVKDAETFSCAANETAIQSALERLGLVVTSYTQYFLKWNLQNADGTIQPLPGGGEIQKNVFCTYKDTFMRLRNDTRHEYPSSFQGTENLVRGLDADSNQLDGDTYYTTTYRDFYLGKNWSKDGQAIDSETVIRQGDVLDYTLNVTHSGNAHYDALPLVDHMSGAQALMAPAAKNSGAEWVQGLQTITDNGAEYYVLSKPGTYHNVWTGEDQLADTVEVTQTESGLDTLIKWYFVDYTGNRKDAVAYRSYVCPNETVSGALSYSLGNECWLNDHQSHRLYASLPEWQGVTFDFDKVIVDAVGDTGDGYRYSRISEGQTVVYRLMLRGSTDKDGKELPLTITGKDMYDALPLSSSTYRWSKENVHITYMDGYTVTNGDSWSVEEPDAGEQQYIKWADDFSMTFTGTAYIYVELDFPTETLWQEYTSKYGAITLTNSFYVLSVQRSVTHDVIATARVCLQKGVYSTGYIDGNYNYTSSDVSIQDDRLYYQNNDVKVRAVRYYVSLYNGGPTNLYLTDMQDLLPRGFTISTGSINTLTGQGSYDERILKDDGSFARKMLANVTVTTNTDENGRQRAVFHFTRPTTSSPLISYDEDKGMCYLKPGEAIDFIYVCLTNNAADTDDAALNIVTMPYYDFNGGGVVVDDQCQIIAASIDKYTPNDGGCDVMNNGQAESLGFTGGTSDTQWLTSEVTMIRGAIKPGITKTLTSKTDQNGSTTQKPVSAAPSDVLNWTIKTENDGTNSISDYVLTDRMQAPYMFTGKVSYVVYNIPDSSKPVAKPTSDYLFTIAKGTSDETLSIRTNRNDSQTLTIGGEPITVSCDWYYSIGGSSSERHKSVNVRLSVVRDTEGNAVMSLRFEDATMAIPENGYSELTLSTYNASNTLENKQFVNACFVTPLAQVWDGTTNKGNVTALDTPFREGELPSVRNSVPVTTSFGYVTSSSKRVAEVENPDNTAACVGDPNYIVLGDETKLFRYTIAVENSTPKAMDMLVLIDGLPEVGDHTVFLASDLRFSEFKVSLADNPDLSVTVTDKAGNVTALDAGSYTIEYSTKTEFTSDDWKGTSQWSTSAENARSIRLKIFDQAGTLIPAESTVSLSFTCKIDDPDVQPGQAAWNSFGYHYSLMDESAELEAAPLKVGVRTPSVPELRKQVVNHSGMPYTAEQDETFQFLVYPGAALSGEYATKEELVAALGDTPYEEFSVVLKAGESLSESVRLETDKWAWTKGQQYTVVELPCSENYKFRRFLNSTASSYVLTYTPAQTQVITCENTNVLWSIDLTKENTSHEPLGGAVFALYSPLASDQLSAVPEGYANLNVALSMEYNDKTWYLVSVQTTAEDGKLNWEGLLREEYYLLEVKAPDGYNIDSPAGQILKQENETQGVYSVIVINRAGYSLPETGGTGTHLYALGGFLLLLSAGALMLYQRTKRRKEAGASD